MYKIRLENTVTHQIYEQQVEDGNNGESLYFRFGISTFDLVDGEYILTLFDAEGNVLAEDLLRIGDYNPDTLQYTKGEKTYLDVTVEGLIQKEVNVVLDTVNGRGIPDLGYDAVETVWINAQPLYDSARAEGYDEGYGLGLSVSYPKGYEDGYDQGNKDGFAAGSEDAYPKGYDDGYNKGTEDGFVAGSEDAYPKGYESGYDVGKTDGYNEGYDVGSTDMYIEMLEETRVLNVTENGRYITKYTEDPYIPTGDGDFANFCKLTNTTYKMGRLKSYDEAVNTGGDVIEFWWKPKDLAYNHRPMILMSSIEDDGNGIHHTFSINLLTYDREDKLRFRSDAGGGTFVEYIIGNPEMWYHILYDKGNIYINDEFVGTLGIVNDNKTSYVYINGDTRNDTEDGIDECNGYFGMVKVNGDVFVPTENGYVYQNKGTIVQPIESGEYEFFLQKDPEGGLYRTVNVNIDTKQYFLDGYDEGYELGVAESYPTGYENGYVQGKTEGYNDGYSEGKTEGVSEGYEQGKAEGYDIGLAESYPKGYEDGYNTAGSEIAETARVLEITENGIYRSQYSEVPFEKTGDDFYNYTLLTNVSYDTGVVIDKNSVIEFWIKPYDLVKSTVRTVFGLTEEWRIYSESYTYNVCVGDVYGLDTYIGGLKLNEWNHIVFDFAKNEGLFNGEKITPIYFVSFLPEGKTLIINGDKYDESPFNGYFGMIKINDIVFIPTENGFMNTATGEYLQKRSEGEYEYIAPVMPSGNLIKTVNVNVVPTVKFADYGMKCSYSTFKTLPSWIDLNGVTDCSYMFTDSNLEEAPYFDTSSTTNMSRMFANNYYIKTVPLYYTKNCKNLKGMFSNAQKLQTIPNFEIGTDVDISELVYGCTGLTSFPAIDIKGAKNIQNMFNSCTSLTEIPALDASGINPSTYNGASLIGFSELKNITKAGGLLNLRRKIDDNYGWVKTPNLDYESCINILNGLYDFTGNGVTPTSNEAKLKVHQNFLNLVGDDITIGTNKGWTITT